MDTRRNSYYPESWYFPAAFAVRSVRQGERGSEPMTGRRVRIGTEWWSATPVVVNYGSGVGIGEAQLFASARKDEFEVRQLPVQNVSGQEADIAEVLGRAIPADEQTRKVHSAFLHLPGHLAADCDFQLAAPSGTSGGAGAGDTSEAGYDGVAGDTQQVRVRLGVHWYDGVAVDMDVVPEAFAG